MTTPSPAVRVWCMTRRGLAAFVATFIRRTSASTAGLTASSVATLGVLLGVFATRGGTTELNFIYHRTVLGVVVLSVVVLIVGRALPGIRHRAAR